MNTYGYVAANPMRWWDIEGFAKGGKQNIRDTGMVDMSDEEVSRQARDPNASKEERQKAKKEEKARKQRNKRKRVAKNTAFLKKCVGIISPALAEALYPAIDRACPNGGGPRDPQGCDDIVIPQQ